MIGQAIPQDNRIAHKIKEQSTQVKYCFNLPNDAQMLCFNKLTGEYNAKQDIVFKKDKATLHVISKRCEDTCSKLFQLN